MQQVEIEARILRAVIEYERETFYENKLGKLVSDGKRKERIALDSEKETLECYQAEGEISCMQCYQLHSKMKYAMQLFASLNFFDSPTLLYGDILPDPKVTAVFTITVEYADGVKKQRRGNFNRLELPPGYQAFIQLVEYLKDYGHNDLLSYEQANRMPRRASDLMFCRVAFHPGERTYSYLCEIPSIQSGTWVLVPVGKDNRMAVGYVERIEYHQPDNAPFPLDRIKKIRCECTQQTLQDLEDSLTEEAKVTNASLLRSRMCPLFGCKLYKRGRGGCMDVQAFLDNEELPMDIFPRPFDEDEAFEVCYDCEWSKEAL